MDQINNATPADYINTDSSTINVSRNNAPNKKMNKLLVVIPIIFLLALLGLSIIFKVKEVKNDGQKPTASPTSPVSSSLTPTPGSESGEIKLTLTKGKEEIIPGTDITILYKEYLTSSESCADCSSSTEIEISNKIDSKMLHFTCGGIAGDCIQKISAYGYNIILEKTEANTAEVKIIRQ